ncbi:MAG: nitroreductase family protein [Vicinamibacteria bacterium]|nr:nitroreductase family protein [Vicinamibacteria bacterium]
MNPYPFVPLPPYEPRSPEQMKARAREFYEEIKRRRTVREFSPRPVPREVIEDCLRAAGTAPSGANLQPWHFEVVSDPEAKKKIREAAEIEEREFYSGKAPQEWLDALAPLGTDEHKSYLEVAPYLIAVFAQNYSLLPDGRKVKNYYVTESVGIALGFLIAALHHAGLATLTHTPSPMGFLSTVLDRPANERAYLLLVVGYPADDARVPDIQKKPLDGIATFR